MSDDMMALSHSYAALRDAAFPESEYFFPARGGGPYTATRMSYMGHKQQESTAYYIHLLPENLFKSAGIDWESMGKLLPRTELWRE